MTIMGARAQALKFVSKQGNYCEIGFATNSVVEFEHIGVSLLKKMICHHRKPS
jgi:hypothetical protein